MPACAVADVNKSLAKCMWSCGCRCCSASAAAKKELEKLGPMSHFQLTSLPLIITTVMHISNRCAVHSSLLLLLTLAPFSDVHNYSQRPRTLLMLPLLPRRSLRDLAPCHANFVSSQTDKPFDPSAAHHDSFSCVSAFAALCVLVACADHGLCQRSPQRPRTPLMLPLPQRRS
jgi:hypothetical protein